MENPSQSTAARKPADPMTHRTPDSSKSDPYKRDPKSRLRPVNSFETNPWRDNHGNLLVGFTAILCLIGASILACRPTRAIQSRLSQTPPAIPEIEGSDDGIAGMPTATQSDVRRIPLRIYGAASDDGVMKIAMYVDADDFNMPEKAFEVDRWKIVDGVCSGLWEVPTNLQEFAFAVYHDVNENNVLDRNPLGIPSERYGFSNGARGAIGPPTFAEAAINSDENIDISIR